MLRIRLGKQQETAIVQCNDVHRADSDDIVVSFYAWRNITGRQQVVEIRWSYVDEGTGVVD